MSYFNPLSFNPSQVQFGAEFKYWNAVFGSQSLSGSSSILLFLHTCNSTSEESEVLL